MISQYLLDFSSLWVQISSQWDLYSDMLIPAHTCLWLASCPLERLFWRVLKVLQWLLSQLHSWCGSAIFFFSCSFSGVVTSTGVHSLVPLSSTAASIRRENTKWYNVVCPATLELSCQGIRSEPCGMKKNREWPFPPISVTSVPCATPALLCPVSPRVSCENYLLCYCPQLSL